MLSFLIANISTILGRATQMYERVLETLITQDMSGKFLSACNMVPEEVSLGATCSYGQLLSHSGKFNEAEDYLTRALKKAEEKFGANHPVLTCVDRMYKLKAKSEGEIERKRKKKRGRERD
uniref:Kinesin light chain n=1 Tax=Oryza brachyantha TaxID=4533 RepID=J3M7W4_ORYBR